MTAFNLIIDMSTCELGLESIKYLFFNLAFNFNTQPPFADKTWAKTATLSRLTAIQKHSHKNEMAAVYPAQELQLSAML